MGLETKYLTDNDPCDVSDHYAKSRVGHIFQKKSEYRFKKNIITSGQGNPQSISMYEFLY